MTDDEAIELVLGWADLSLPEIDREKIEEAAKVARAYVERLRTTLQVTRNRLHAANRPTMRDGLRIELRDLIDAALAAAGPAKGRC